MADTLKDRIAQAIVNPGSIVRAEDGYPWRTHAVLTVLKESGRLLPEGAERNTQVMLSWTFADDKVIEWGPPDFNAARELAKTPPEGAVAGVIRSRDHWAGPWVDVEPVEVSDVD